jgi:hypothetical protein
VAREGRRTVSTWVSLCGEGAFDLSFLHHQLCGCRWLPPLLLRLLLPNFSNGVNLAARSVPVPLCTRWRCFVLVAIHWLRLYCRLTWAHSRRQTKAFSSPKHSATHQQAAKFTELGPVLRPGDSEVGRDVDIRRRQPRL